MDKQQLQARIESVEKRLRTNLESVEKKLIDLQNDIANFKAKLDEVQDEEIPEFPVFNCNGEVSWHINNVLEVSTSGITSGHTEDYNYFHTEEMAQEFADKCKLIAMMMHCKWYIDRDYKPDWSDGGFKHFVYYDNSQNKFVNDYVTSLNVETVFFSTEESAKKCADWLNERMMKNG